MDSVGGLLVLLHEDDIELRGSALSKLHGVVDNHWSEILEQIENIETLASEERFQHQKIAAAIASKCYYHLEEYSVSLQYALKAGEHFDVKSSNEYEVTIVGKAIQAYIELHRREREDKDFLENLDDEDMIEDETLQLLEMKDDLERIVNGLFEKCYANGSFHEALGIAMEAHELEKVRTTIQRSGSMMREVLTDCLKYCLRLVKNRDFRRKVMEVLVELYEEQANPNFLELATVLHALYRVEDFAKLLLDLIRDDEGFLIAYQIAFDLMELQDQNFVAQVLKKLPKSKPVISQNENEEENKEEETQPTEPRNEKLETLVAILAENKASSVYLDFLYHHNKTDLLILKNVKNALLTAGRKHSVLHNATIMMHAFAQAGTTVDSFFRTDQKFLQPATHWARFSASATIGVIHKGNVTSSKTVLDTFLPKETAKDAYLEGGALYAMGLIHALEGSQNETGKEALEYLKDKLRSAMAEGNLVIKDAHQHGACLGIGLVAMASGDTELARMLMSDIVNQDRAVPAEAAALAIGMVLQGGGGEVHKDLIDDMLAYAMNTKHEKIIRALAMGVAMIMYGQEESADTLIEQLTVEKDSLLRYGAMYLIGFAYAGTANNVAIRRLLRTAVSDVANDVRRAAVTNLGFVLLNSPERLPSLIELLSESYNPYVRYGSALAIGIACAGMSDPSEALNLLVPLREDKVDFVRQGAMIATAMLMMQQNPERNEKAKAFRAKLAEIVADGKHSSTMTRMGAILATGIIDAGGRNVNIGLISRSGRTKPPAVVGMALFSQYWYWYPLMHLITLSFAPTALVGLNKDLDMPNDFRVECDADLSLYDYAKPLTTKKAAKQERVETAVLSMTAKAKAAEAAKAKENDIKPMEIDTKKEDDSTEKEVKKTDEELERERQEALQNPLRVTRLQKPKIRFMKEGRYQPVAQDEAHKSGIVILRDTTPGEEEDVRQVVVPQPGSGDTNNTNGATEGVSVPSGFVFHPQNVK